MNDKQKFEAYVKVQKSGKFNMLTEARQAASAAKLPLEAYMSVIRDYNKLSDEYPEVLK